MATRNVFGPIYFSFTKAIVKELSQLAVSWKFLQVWCVAANRSSRSTLAVTWSARDGWSRSTQGVLAPQTLPRLIGAQSSPHPPLHCWWRCWDVDGIEVSQVVRPERANSILWTHANFKGCWLWEELVCFQGWLTCTCRNIRGPHVFGNGINNMVSIKQIPSLPPNLNNLCTMHRATSGALGILASGPLAIWAQSHHQQS